ncbi:putative membrane-bound O-acyltransferase C24H6.01c isoform X3 [Durio zibethinus]|uniref:Membrane-bound O-acyltransferase C24H6.01c isoform X3 n=1 Tax=Durio zibethinus TaxID=66656 RepID=A0A6P6ALC7_DURZI|nr:putative membrane-bound O-acyltransferase C24H6.01c isoform X3 [Durio zibethinus]
MDMNMNNNNNKGKSKLKQNQKKRVELILLILYAIGFYAFCICRSLHLSRDHFSKLHGLRAGWLFPPRLNDVSDAQWRNFRANLPILTLVFGVFTMLANIAGKSFHFRAKGMSIIWLFLSLIYLSYLHGACIIFILLIASANFLLVKIFANAKYFPLLLWIFNLVFLFANRVYQGYSFSKFGRQHWAYLDKFRGTFRWHICFNFVILRMISFGYDYHWAHRDSHFDQEKHIRRCHVCKSGKVCYQILQERNVHTNNFAFTTYLSYLVYAPLYIAGPIISFNAFASQLDVPQNHYSIIEVTWYGLRWVFSLSLMELMTHLFYFNAFAASGSWKKLSPMDIFIIGYGVVNFMWLKFFLIWRYFRFWSLIAGIEAPENMPKCVNNCQNLESFWKSWHASFNKWIVRYMYIPLGGSQRKLLNIWVIFTFVAVWHDLEWKLLSWAWLTCLFFVPEMLVKSAANAFQAEGALGGFVFRELSAVAGAITITCLMVANLVGYVIGPSGINWLISRFLSKEGLHVLGFMLTSFYVGTKLMFQIHDAKQRMQ